MHFFCEDIGRIAFFADVCDGDATIINPFLSGILIMFGVLITLRGQIVAPFYTCFVVNVKWGSQICVIDGITK
jgi:hypothetical protein